MSKRYVIIMTRLGYVGGQGYEGAACERAGIEGGKIYESRKEAKKNAEYLTQHNCDDFSVEVYYEALFTVSRI